MSETVPAELSRISCAFTRAYVEAAFFSTGSDQDGGEPLEECFHVTHLSPETWAAVRRDCEAFLAANGDLIEACEEHHRPGSPGDTAMAHAGRDFWFTREGHGSGFWDGDWPEAAGEHLSKASKAFGEASWYVGDDGRIWQSRDETFRPDGAPELARPSGDAFPEAAPAPSM